jgi:hypothetical protein
MGKRSGVIDGEEDLAKLSLAELDSEIDRCRMRLKLAPTSQLRKSFESRIHWLERFRVKHHYDVCE